MKELTEYGRTTIDRVNFLINALSEKEKKNYFRLESFIKIWAASTGGSADINENTDFFIRTNTYALRQIDAVFFKKFGLHIEKNSHQLQMNEDEWANGIKPISHND
ncbi:hypothetical protein JMR96_004209 [Salmonella enterica]|nr:hypothetical protein [Salmonella enterica]EKC9049897.1 hypothetical protein [Salmonella enterica]ELV0562037.1 hypothetical protein [Salmonella enterica]